MNTHHEPPDVPQQRQPVLDTEVSTQPDGPVSAPMVAALEQAWTAIRVRHPQVPAAVVVLGAGSIGAPAGGLRLGHFAALRWHHDTRQLPEVFVGGEGLDRGPGDVLATLLHEAAHALADVRGIKDTSRQGRWHNARFKQLATEVGIETTKDPRIGWSPTTLPETIRAAYTDTITALGAALRMHRTAEISSGQGAKTKTPPGVCDYGRRIRVAPTVLAAGPITCGICGTDFTPDQPQDQP